MDPDIRPPPPTYPKGIPGNILMFDGLAIESKCRYCPRRGHVMGLCREHSSNVDTKVTDRESVEKIRTFRNSPSSISLAGGAPDYIRFRPFVVSNRIIRSEMMIFDTDRRVNE
ncbi:hypothetical protein M413DRAFT_447174 [Hebeloma cylindrosporum]|uniref:Uncharacterized protein n=1 Tax=Hebeloma cylindrosporum TaxID=76867 RepID=A0A0C3C6K3_HEBCY|nr:hypothetical protein M413DRAFT_447174 [Hebeloma cylindrosporum h7]